jgi:SAM-dependent MidA family methyltransferase
LQAVHSHGYAPILADPGEQDLTAHVDFEAVADQARAAGASVSGVVPQGDWLIRLGIEVRAQSLSRANPERAEEIERAVDRLTARDQMGQLFKAIALHSPDWPMPAGFA